MGKRDFGFIRTDSAVFFPRLAFETGKPDRPVTITVSYINKQEDFPSA